MGSKADVERFANLTDAEIIREHMARAAMKRNGRDILLILKRRMIRSLKTQSSITITIHS